MPKYQAILFDLDGTLLDTASDIAFALNHVRQEYHLAPLPLDMIRDLISEGTKGMIKHSFNLEETDADFPPLRDKIFRLYEAHIADKTRLFPGMEQVITHLTQQHIPWGIVTNKSTKHTHRLLQALNLKLQPQCIVCGDTLTTFKPDPAPVLHACKLLQQPNNACLYIGDSINDVKACQAANVPVLVALYGYIDGQTDPYTWQANGYIKTPLEILQWLHPSC